MIKAEYTSHNVSTRFSKSRVACEMVITDTGAHWIYQENGKLVSCSHQPSKSEALKWFAHVYQDMNPTFTLY